MRDDPRSYWNDRYRDQTPPDEPSSFLTNDLAPFLSEPGRALDIAGGGGRNALWLAALGWHVTLVDISDEATTRARAEAERRGLVLTIKTADLTTTPLPGDSADLVMCIHYLQRDLFPVLRAALAPSGLLAFSIATMRNLERHERPPRPYLLDEGEAISLVEGMDLLYAFEGWSDEDRHEARIVARLR